MSDDFVFVIMVLTRRRHKPLGVFTDRQLAESAINQALDARFPELWERDSVSMTYRLKNEPLGDLNLAYIMEFRMDVINDDHLDDLREMAVVDAEIIKRGAR